MPTAMVHSTDELLGKAAAILSAFPHSRIFALSGQLGAGKTTLVKAFGEILNVEDKIHSPTFSLVNEYSSLKTGPVYHLDLYRMERLEDFYDIGYEEYLYSGHYCFLEWPDLIRELLPQTYVYINIEVVNKEKRRIEYNITSQLR